MSKDGRGSKKKVLTSSRLKCRRKCARMDFYQYILRWRREQEAKPLRFGGAYHEALELHDGGMSDGEVMGAIDEAYSTPPPWSTAYDWLIEAATLKALVAGHIWRYQNDDATPIVVEEPFCIPLVNPVTGSKSRSFNLGGVIDRIDRLNDGRLAVHERKTTVDDISDGSDYWTNLRYDGQISQYYLGAAANCFPVETIIYDVTRKPGMKPSKIGIFDDDLRGLDLIGREDLFVQPAWIFDKVAIEDDQLRELQALGREDLFVQPAWIEADDEDHPDTAGPAAGRKIVVEVGGAPALGRKIALCVETGDRVYNKNGKTPRQTGAPADGIELLTRRETPEEWGERLLEDIGTRPDYYYQRREIPRLEDDMIAFQCELWQQSKVLLEAAKHHWHFRSVDKFTCGFCAYRAPCLSGAYEPDSVDPETPPSGFVRLDMDNPEIARHEGRITNGKDAPSEAARQDDASAGDSSAGDSSSEPPANDASGEAEAPRAESGRASEWACPVSRNQ